MKTAVVTIWFAILGVGYVMSETNLEDQSAEGLLEQSQNLGSGQLDQALELVDRVLEFQTIAEKPLLEARAREWKATLLGRKGLHLDSIPEYFRALELCRIQDPHDRVDAILSGIGIAYYYTGDAESSISYHLEALALRREGGTEDDIGKTLNNIGLVYFSIEEHEKAIEYFLQSLDLKRKGKDLASVTRTLSNLGYCYYHIGKYEKATAFHLEAQEISEAIGYEKGHFYALNNLADIAFKRKEYQTAIDGYRKSLDFFIRDGDYHAQILVINGYASTLSAMGRTKQALELLKDSVERGKSIGVKPRVRDGYEKMATLYEELGDYRRALEARKAFEEWKDKVRNDETANRLQKLNMDFMMNLKNSQIQHLEKENLLKTEQLQLESRARWLLYALVLGGFLVAGLLLVLIQFKRREIRQRIQAQQQVETEKEQLDQILRSIREGVILTDSQNRIAQINQSGCELIGLSRSELLEQKLGALLKLWDKGHEALKTDDVLEALLKQPERAVKYKMQSVKGDSRQVAISGCALVSSQRSPGRIFVIRDVQIEHDIEEEAARNQKLKTLGQLAGVMAHDFNNLLSAMRGNINLLTARAELKPRELRYIDSFESALKSAESLSGKLLTFAEGGEPVRQIVLASDLIEGAVRRMLEPSGFAWTLENHLGSVSLELDEAQFNQALENVLDNAIQAMDGPGKLSIRVREERLDAGNEFKLAPGSFVRVVVEDQGRGIPIQHREHIFDPFFSGRDGHTGMGLAEALSILSNHGGTLTLDASSASGSVFSLFLPCANQPEEPTGDEAKPVSLSHKILIMDDETYITEVLGEMLEMMGFDVTVTHRGEEAISAYRQVFESGAWFDLVILDLSVPNGLGGRETMEQLLEIDPTIRAVVSSGYSHEPVMARFREYGFCDRLPKPYSLNELKELLRHHGLGPANTVADC